MASTDTLSDALQRIAQEKGYQYDTITYPVSSKGSPHPDSRCLLRKDGLDIRMPIHYRAANNAADTVSSDAIPLDVFLYDVNKPDPLEVPADVTLERRRKLKQQFNKKMEFYQSCRTRYDHRKNLLSEYNFTVQRPDGDIKEQGVPDLHMRCWHPGTVAVYQGNLDDAQTIVDLINRLA